jgi:hypothetical protein
MDIFDDDKGPIKVMKSKALDRKEIARLQGIDFNDYKEKGVSEVFSNSYLSRPSR